MRLKSSPETKEMVTVASPIKSCLIYSLENLKIPRLFGMMAAYQRSGGV
jgi:hypothetical protein